MKRARRAYVKPLLRVHSAKLSALAGVVTCASDSCLSDCE
jgi:hypothetical protein